MTSTVFKQVNYPLSALIESIDLGEIGLPDIQRPFIWKNAKVRDLFDSMYKGYPVGYLLFWQNGVADDSRGIGTDLKQKPPRLLIVDGQQRLTSLFAVLRNVQIVRANYEKGSIHIAFNPLLEKFEVADAAIQKDKAYIPNISRVWSKETDLFEVVEEYLEKLESSRDISEGEKKQIKRAISRLESLESFPFTALELSSKVSEEDVADVFVRINSLGVSLKQADFILTLMSVFWDEGRTELEHFCRVSRSPAPDKPSPFNYYIHPDPDQMLRVGVGLGFKRARLQFVYSILRGKDLKTEEFSNEKRIEQFEVLKNAQERALNLQYWNDFLKCLRQAGFMGMKMISSQNNLLFSYILYLMGRTEYKVDEFTLRKTIARWFYMSSLTGRFTGSPESAMEFDLARLREVNDKESFIKVLNQVSDQAITEDYWSITLPNDLATSSPRSPSLFAYYAALVLLDAHVLFSKLKVSEWLDPTTKSPKKPIERHHLFPRKHLKTLGITSTRDTNQIANFALVEWGDNVDIAGRAPDDYLPELKKRFSDAEMEQMYHSHALPENWEMMDYEDFLIVRRELIAKVIQEAYVILSLEKAKEPTEVISLEEIVLGGETTETEFKATMRTNLHTGEKDPRMELAILKTIAGFLNTNGGNLIIGVRDDGAPRGIEGDRFENEDKMNLHLVNLMRDRAGPQHMVWVHPRFEDLEDQRVMVVECWRTKAPVFIKDGKIERFYIRTGSATTELSASQTQEFIKQRFPN